MPLQDQPISIKYGKGLDKKTNPFTVQAGKLLQLQDAVFTNTDELSKRNGNDLMTMSVFGGGTLHNPTLVANYNEELVAAGVVSGASLNGSRLMSYSTTENAWVDKGRYTPVKVTTSNVNSSVYSLENPSAAALGNLVLFASDASVPTTGASNLGYINISVWDMSTNTVLISNVDPTLAYFNSGTGSANCSNAVAVNLGGSQLAIIYESITQTGSSTLNLYCQLITATSGGGVSIGSPIVLATVDSSYSTTSDLPYAFQVTATASGAFVAFDDIDSTTIALLTVSTSGSAVNTASISTGSPVIQAVSTDPTTNYNWVFWYANTSLLYYAVYTSTLGTVLAPTLINNSVLGGGPSNVAAVSIAAHKQQVAYNVSNYVGQVQLTDSGVIGTAYPLVSFGAGLALYSGYFFVENSLGNQIPYLTISTGDTLYFMEATIDPSIGTTGVVGSAFYLSAATFPVFAGSYGSLSNPVVLSSSQILVPAMVNIEAVNPLYTYQYALLDFANQDTSQSVSIPEKALILNGGVVTMYDSQPANELGFFLTPQMTVTVLGSGTGPLPAGTYLLYSVYQWTDALGALHQSTPSLPTSVTIGGSGGSLQVDVYTLTLTQKKLPRNPVAICVYITEAGATVPYLYTNAAGTNSPFFTTVNNSNPTHDVSGQYSRVTVTSVNPNNAILYTSGGILDNDPPPPSTTIVVHNNRLQLVDSTNPNTQWYSKSMTPGVGISMSLDLVNDIDPHAGPIVALAEMDDKLVMFAENAPIILSGDGANDAGQGATYSFPQFIPSDVGCSQSKGVITSPLGVHFKTPKGIYLLDRSLTLKYWGYPVESFNAQTITNSIIMPGTTQIRFLTSDGLTLVYDYFQDQWSTFSNFQGLSGTIWEGAYTYARTDGTIFKENLSGTYLDNGVPYGVLVQTAYMKASLIQGFQRLKSYLHLGTYTNGTSPGHGITASVAYDYGANPDLQGFFPLDSYTFVSPVTSGSYQYRTFLQQQKCESATFLIQENVTGASGENFTMTDMSLILGVKKGNFKLPSNQSI